MGLLSRLFGGGYKNPIGNDEKKLMDAEKQRTQDERDSADALKLKQEEERNALKQRGKSMRGGGRTGLMFGGNQSGVA